MKRGERLQRIFYIPSEDGYFSHYLVTNLSCYAFHTKLKRVDLPADGIDYPLLDDCHNQPIAEIRVDDLPIVLVLANGSKVIFDFVLDFADGVGRESVDFQNAQESARWEEELSEYEIVPLEERKSKRNSEVGHEVCHWPL